MKMYEKSLLVDMLETKILEEYNDYYPQGQYNEIFINYLYKYIRNNTYCGKHNYLLSELDTLKQYSSTLTVKENADLHTYVITDNIVISDKILEELAKILKVYYNYSYLVKSPNRIVISVSFGWLPPNSASFLDLLNDENLIDYHIDGITLVPNVHTSFDGKPESGYVCYKIDDIKEYDTIMFLINQNLKMSSDSKITVASLLTKLEGSKGATLNRIVTTEPTSFFYELGPYNRNYISAKDASLIIEVPYDYAISEYLSVFDVNISVIINNENNPEDKNDKINFFIPFNDYYISFIENSDNFTSEAKDIQPKSINIEAKLISTDKSIVIKDDGKGNLVYNNSNVGTVNYTEAIFNIINDNINYPINVSYQSNQYFIKNEINANTVLKVISSNIELLDNTLVQYVLGDFIWKTSDSKLIAYAQNLVSSLFKVNIIPDGIWSESLSNYVKIFKENFNIQSIFDDDVIDKFTERLMTTEYKRRFNSDPNELFNEW